MLRDARYRLSLLGCSLACLPAPSRRVADSIVTTAAHIAFVVVVRAAAAIASPLLRLDYDDDSVKKIELCVRRSLAKQADNRATEQLPTRP